MTHAPPLLAATDLRVDLEGMPLIERVTFVSCGDSVTLLGESAVLIRALCGEARVAAGSLKLMGYDVDRSKGWHIQGWLGLAPLDPPLPMHMTARAYLVAGGRLAGLGRRDANQAALRTLADLELTALQQRPLSTLQVAELRAVVLAQAVVTDPRVLVAQSPAAQLSGAPADYVTRVFQAACHGRRWVLAASSMVPGSHEHKLALSADEILVFSSGRLVRQTTPSALEGCTGYTLTVRGDLGAFSRALATRGIELTGGPARFWIDLPAHLTPRDLLAISVETRAPIVELYPRLLGPDRC